MITTKILKKATYMLTNRCEHFFMVISQGVPYQSSSGDY